MVEPRAADMIDVRRLADMGGQELLTLADWYREHLSSVKAEAMVTDEFYSIKKAALVVSLTTAYEEVKREIARRMERASVDNKISDESGVSDSVLDPSDEPADPDAARAAFESGLAEGRAERSRGPLRTVYTLQALSDGTVVVSDHTGPINSESSAYIAALMRLRRSIDAAEVLRRSHIDPAEVLRKMWG